MGLLDSITRPTTYSSQQTLTNTAKSNMGILAPQGGSSGGSSGGGTYWRGADGNVWVAGSGGVNSAGAYDNNTDSYWQSRGYTQQADPYSTGTLGASTASPYGSGRAGGSGSGSPAYDPNDLAFLDDQKSALERQYGRTDTTLRDALDAILQNYQTSINDSEVQKSRFDRDWKDNYETSETGRARELDKNDTRARSLANSLRQRIGLASGSGSSAYQITAPRAVQQQASEGRGDILNTYASNFRNLDKSKKDTESDFEKLLRDIENNKNQRTMGAEGDIAEQRNTINSQIRQLEGKRSEIMGGGYKDIRNAMNPWNQRVQQGESLIDSLYSKYAAKYTPRALAVTSPSLQSYATDRAAVRDNTQANNEFSPYKAPFGRDEEEQVTF